jgi:ADP-dependent NAD(P)H-hydrate dehydratase / NAD(P)H-hydrate epimerase
VKDSITVKQTQDSPAFPNLLWSKPENKNLSGKLLIIGGNSFGFSAVGEAYQIAINAGAGEVRVLLPDAIQKIAGGVFSNALFAPTNPSGSFSKDALRTCLDAAMWADGVAIVGDVSRNAETAGMLEQFCSTYKGIISITKDALELLIKQSSEVLLRKSSNLVMTMSDLQLAAKSLHFDQPLTHEIASELFISRLNLLCEKIDANLIIKRQKFLYVCSEGKISQTEDDETETWRIKNTIMSTIWNLQNPNSAFEALTTALIDRPKI